MAPKGSYRRKMNAVDKKKAEKQAEKDKEEEAQNEAAQAAAAERKEKANVLKDEGNAAFSASQWMVALDKFTEAIRLVPDDHVFFSNRSATNLQLLRTADAVRDGQECVRINPSWAKGYSRLGAALLADHQAFAAVAAFEKGLLLDNSNAALKEGLEAAKLAAQAQREQNERERKEQEAEAAEAAARASGAASSETQSRSLEDTTVIGIDLGTTYSCVAVWQHGTVEILEDDQGNKTTPSFVAFTPDGGRLVGDTAKMQAAKNPKNTLFDVKRILGQKMKEPQVQADVKRFPFPVVADEETNEPRIIIDALEQKQMPPEQISALVLGHLKRVAETRLGHKVKKAVITVPAYFNDAQRSATKAAGAIAGLEVLRIINEPTAAALAYGLDNKDDGAMNSGANVLVYDLGGGTFDVSILRIEQGMFNVKATGGDTHLGGEDFDNSVVDHLASVLKGKHGLDITGDMKLERRLRNAAERAKRTLSSGTMAQIEVEDYCLELSRAKFEALNKAQFERTLDTVKAVMKDAKMSPSDIDDIVLVGGSTRIPKIRDMLSEFFGGRQLCRSINPDEAVAYGAAVQGAILSGVRHATTDALLLVDVTPLSLGIECEGKHFSVLIPRNTSIPCKKSDTFTTTEDYQESIDVPVYEGERPCTDGNRKLGEFTIHNIERAKREEAKIEVTFCLDANGILEVVARDKKTGAKADCRIEGACKGLDPAEVARMVKEAEMFAHEDAEYKVQAELRTELESMAYDLQDKLEEKQTEGMASDSLRKVEECFEFLESLEKLGKPETRKALERWIKDLRNLKI